MGRMYFFYCWIWWVAFVVSVCRVFIFKDTGVRPHLSVGLISVRQKGGLPGTPPRNTPPRIPRCPGAKVMEGSHARV